MARRGTWSVLRRKGSQAGGLALLCAVLVLPAQAATPSPDPPPLAVAPEPPPAAKTQPAPVRSTPVVATPAPAVQRPAPVVRVQPVQTPAAPKATVKAKPKPTAKPKAAAKRTARVVEPVAAPRVPHDRARVPLVAFVPAVDELDRGLLAVAGIALLLVALGGAVLLASRGASCSSPRSGCLPCSLLRRVQRPPQSATRSSAPPERTAGTPATSRSGGWSSRQTSSARPRVRQPSSFPQRGRSRGSARRPSPGARSRVR